MIKKTKENNKGITLIALVITIIVLLILAGVSITMLTGENGILTKAQTASQENKEKGAIEKAKIAVAGSWDNNGNLSLDELQTELNKVQGKSDLVAEKFPVTLKIDEIGITISDKGKVELSDAAKPTVEEITPESLGKSSSDWSYDKEEKAINGYVGADRDTMTEVVIPNTLIIDGQKYLVEKVLPGYYTEKLIRQLHVSIFNSYESANTKVSPSKFNTAITKITVSPGIKVLGESVFVQCNALKDIVLNEGLERIEDEAFFGTTGPNEIVIPASVTYIGFYCFDTKDYKNVSIRLLSNDNGDYYIHEESGKAGQIAYIGKFYYPDNIVAQSNKAGDNQKFFYRIDGEKNEATLIEIKEYHSSSQPIMHEQIDGVPVTTIESNVCDSVNSLAIPTSVKTIKTKAFAQAKDAGYTFIDFTGSNLENMNIGDGWFVITNPNQEVIIDYNKTSYKSIEDFMNYYKSIKK